VAGFYEHPYREQGGALRSEIHFVWAGPDWQPCIEINKLGHPILFTRNEPYRGFYRVDMQEKEHGAERIANIRAALLKAGAPTARTFKQKEGEIVQRVVVPGVAELHVYSWDHVAETLAFRRKVLRLAQKTAPYRLISIDPITGRVIEGAEPRGMKWLGALAAQRFVDDPDFWPLLYGDPEKPLDDPYMLMAEAPYFGKAGT